MGSKGIVLSLLFFTAAGIGTYWTLVFFGVFEIIDVVPGYKDWFMSFPLADGWIAVCALISGIYLLRGNPAAGVFGIAAGSGLIFLGLCALLYGFNTRLLFNITGEELIEIAIKLYCLSVGSYFIMYFGKAPNHF